MTTAANRSGSIAVLTNDRGLPQAIHLDDAELQRGPESLAHEILRICRQATRRGGAQRRAELESAGVPDDILARLGLPTPAQVAAEELAEQDQLEAAPSTWMRAV